MPRFSVLAHDHPTPHWDLFLEAGPALRSWRLPSGLEPGIPVPVEPTADHRLAYLDYEGPVSSNRGSVTRLAAGTFDWVLDEPDRVVVRLHARPFDGMLELSRGPGGWTAVLNPC